MKNLNPSIYRCFVLALTATWVVGCAGAGSSDSGSGGSSSGGSTATGGTSNSGGSTGSGGKTSSGGSTSTTGGATSTGGTSSGGVTSTGGTSSGGATSTGGASSGGATSTGGSSTGGAIGSGGSDSTGGKGAAGGKGATGGKAASGGASGGGSTGSGGATTGSGGSGAGGKPAAGSPEFGSGAARTLGYLGCSMSMNVASGYATLGGQRLWPSIGAYGAQVVQNWKVEGGPWSGFDGAVKQYGAPTDVWIMLCIFGSGGVTLDETKQIIALTKKHAPNAKLYITGQPLNTGTDCSLAGNGGAAKTDSIAMMAAADSSLGVIYAGIFGPLTVDERMSDTCHANTAGEKVLGQQVIDKWGK